MQTPPPSYLSSLAVISEDLDVITLFMLLTTAFVTVTAVPSWSLGTDKSFTIFWPETNKGRQSTRSRSGPVKSSMIFRPSARSVAHNIIYIVHTCTYIPKHIMPYIHRPTYLHAYINAYIYIHRYIHQQLDE